MQRVCFVSGVLEQLDPISLSNVAAWFRRSVIFLVQTLNPGTTALRSAMYHQIGRQSVYTLCRFTSVETSYLY